MLSSLLLAVTIVAHDPGYYTSLSQHARRWLEEKDIAAEVITPKEMNEKLANEKLALLLGFDSPTREELATLRAYRERGGKLVVFYSSSKALAAMMDVKVLDNVRAAYPGQWSRMVFSGGEKAGFPASILQTSTILLRAEPQPGKGRVLATWADRRGKSDGTAAWIVTAGGFWMTHVLTADGDEDLKAQLLAAIVGTIVPGMWNPEDDSAKRVVEQMELEAYARQQTPCKGEIHAVWDHSGCGLYPGDWAKTMRILKASQVTDLFVNVAGAGFAHYPSEVLPRSKTFADEGDQLAACLAAAKGTGIRVHAWLLCFTATRSSGERLKIFRERGWCLKTPKGKVTDYLDPANADIRNYLFSAIDELQRMYPSLAGIHLDFVRWGDWSMKPANAAQVVSDFVAEARRHVKRPRWLTTAVYGKYPNCVTTVGQDWMGWVNANLVDYVVPMDYAEDLTVFKELLESQSQFKTQSRKTIIGIGVTANESRLSPRQVIEQIQTLRGYGFAGEALFDLDTTLEKRVLPALRLGLWR